MFLEVLRSTPRGKAVGAGGFSIELLINASDGVKRMFYDALMTGGGEVRFVKSAEALVKRHTKLQSAGKAGLAKVQEMLDMFEDWEVEPEAAINELATSDREWDQQTMNGETVLPKRDKQVDVDLKAAALLVRDKRRHGGADCVGGRLGEQATRGLWRCCRHTGEDVADGWSSLDR